jgi:predicted nucleotidyltransferase
MAQKSLPELLATLRHQLPLLKELYQVQTLGVFGSYRRQEQTPDSDLDLLVTFCEIPGLLKFIELENYLSDLLGVKVDLVMEEALKPHINERVRQEIVSV